MKDNLKKLYYVLDNKFYFKLLYLFVSLTFVTILKCIPKINVLSKVLLVWAALILIFNLVHDNKRRKVYTFDIFLTLFLGITFVFTVAIYRTSEDIKIWIINLILFGAVFTIDVFRNKKKLVKEMNMITYFYVGFMFIASTISLIMKYTNKVIEIGDFVFGAEKGGIFENKNAVCIAAAIALIMSLYLKYICKSFKINLFLLINSVIQILVMISFKGRSSYLLIIGFVYTFILIMIKNKYLRGLFIAAPLCAICAMSFNLEGENIRNFTSGRTSLWHCGRLVIEDHPLTGVGKGQMIERLSEKSVNQDLPGIEYGGLHNIYVQIGTVNGLLSLVAFLIFIAMILTVIIKKIDNLRKKEKMQMTYILSIIVGILVVNLFESTLIYIISFISLTFWIYLGYLVSILDNKNID